VATKNLLGAGDTYRFGVTGSPVTNVVQWWADDLSVSTVGWIGPTGIAPSVGVTPAPLVVPPLATIQASTW
jgi:hypothetical protein